jgi:hypothetical protein
MAATASTDAAPPEAATGPAGDAQPRTREVERPVGTYTALMAAFNVVFAGALVAGRRRLPERFAAGDLALMAVGTHKLSRLVAKERVTSGIRAPFTRVERDDAADAEREHARGRGLRRALGELLLCPYCLDQWIAAGFVAGMVLAPRSTRAVASMFTVVAGADALQHGYRLMQARTAPSRSD